MNHETAIANAKEVADRVLAPAARQNDKEAGFSSEAVTALGSAGLLGMMLPAEVGGAALGPRTFAAVVATLAEADASVAMVYLMHVCAAATIAAARNGAAVAPTLKEIAAGRHLSTLAFSETGSRSHFWAPVSRARRNAAGVHITAKKSFADQAQAKRTAMWSRHSRLRAPALPTRRSISFQAARAACRWRAPGTVLVCGPTPPRR